MKARQFNTALLRLRLLFLGGAVTCEILYRWIGVRVDVNGVLREPFALIPIGYLLACGALGTGIAWLLRTWYSQRS